MRARRLWAQRAPGSVRQVPFRASARGCTKRSSEGQPPINDADRVKLLFGPYRAPRCRVGQRVRCEVRGEVTIVGLSDAPIPWPLCRCGKWRVPVVYRGLARAVRRESELAVARWWGIAVWSAWQWRKALGVGPTTEDTARLRRDHFAEPWGQAARAKAHARSRDAEANTSSRPAAPARTRGTVWVGATLYRGSRMGASGSPKRSASCCPVAVSV
jgi:hypothetical protein